MTTMRRKREESNEESYIIANLSRNDIENGGASNFTLGDGKMYGGYKNTALEDGMEYSVKVGYASCTPKVYIGRPRVLAYDFVACSYCNWN